jgi:succinate dehydrogenase / fumarate reductase, flavoprotein subunit
MMDKVSVVRNETGLREAQQEIAQLQDAYKHISLQDKGKRYNTELLEALELGCMLDCAETIVHGALMRNESRGAHYREDFEARDDKNWLAHSMITRTPDGLQLEKKPIVITMFEPKERKY